MPNFGTKIMSISVIAPYLFYAESDDLIADKIDA